MKLQDLLTMIGASTRDSWLRDADMGIATLIEDLNVTIREDRITLRDQDAMVAPWAIGFADPDAREFTVALYYGAAFIKRYRFASVDGGRASIPFPTGTDELSISREQYRIAIAIDHDHNLDEYLRRNGGIRVQ